MLRIASVIVLCVLMSDARRLDERAKREQWEEFEEFLEWKRMKQLHESNSVDFLTRAIGFDDDPDAYRSSAENDAVLSQPALMARYVVNQADWAAIATISTRKDIQMFPFANLISISDGPVGNGTGIPYTYLTPLDSTTKDLAKDRRATLLVSLAQGSYCKDKNLDPMDPRCARVMLTGKITALKNATKEYEIAKQLFFNRHPKLINMPADHKFFFAKLKILTIVLLDNFGGPKYISIKDYLHPPVGNVGEKLQYMQRLFSDSIDSQLSVSLIS